MTKFKHGDRVTCELSTMDGWIEIKDGRISIDRDGDAFVCQDIRPSYQHAEKALGYKNTWYIKKSQDWEVRNLKLKNKTMDNLEVGDVLVDEDGDEQKILGMCDMVYFLSRFNDFNKADDCPRTLAELKGMSYKLKGVEEEEEELTMDELCKELGRTVKIKK